MGGGLTCSLEEHTGRKQLGELEHVVELAHGGGPGAMAEAPAISVRPAALPGDFEAILSTVNDAAEAYRGVIPTDAVRARRGS